jgi:hypothetical protein
VTDDPATLRRQLAAYAGTVSRACDLLGLTPDIQPGQSKPDVELDALCRHLDQLAAEQRRLADLTF